MNLNKLKLAAVVLAFASSAHAYEVNMQDKTDTYDLKSNGQTIGKLKVTSKFRENAEPLIESVDISVTAECAKGAAQTIKWRAYDYGSKEEQTLLSKFDSSKNDVTVFYWEGKSDDDGYVTHDKAKTRHISTKDFCVAKK